MHRLLKHILLRKNSSWSGSNPGRRNLELDQFTRKKRVFGDFATNSLSCVRATSVFFLRRAASASKIFAHGRR